MEYRIAVTGCGDPTEPYTIHDVGYIYQPGLPENAFSLGPSNLDSFSTPMDVSLDPGQWNDRLYPNLDLQPADGVATPFPTVSELGPQIAYGSEPINLNTQPEGLGELITALDAPTIVQSPKDASSLTLTLERTQQTEAPPHVLIGTVLSNGNSRADIFRCYFDECSNKTFGRLPELKRHYNTQHTVAAPQYWCSVAGCKRGRGDRPFARKDKLADHVRKVHGGAARTGTTARGSGNN